MSERPMEPEQGYDERGQGDSDIGPDWGRDLEASPDESESFDRVRKESETGDSSDEDDDVGQVDGIAERETEDPDEDPPPPAL